LADQQFLCQSNTLLKNCYFSATGTWAAGSYNPKINFYYSLIRRSHQLLLSLCNVKTHAGTEANSLEEGRSGEISRQ
jgi:hypothetical protein